MSAHHFKMFSNHGGQFTTHFYPVATAVTSNLLSLAWRLRLHSIVSSNDPKPRPKCALSARKCIAQYRLKFQIIHCQLFFWIRPCRVPFKVIKYNCTRSTTVDAPLALPLVTLLSHLGNWLCNQDNTPLVRGDFTFTEKRESGEYLAEFNETTFSG